MLDLFQSIDPNTESFVAALAMIISFIAGKLWPKKKNPLG